MAIVLGIDTGGTFTDSVIVNTETKEILCKAKALTTKDDLTRGIRNSIEQLPEELRREVSVVSLSTTLATNAVVENRRCRTGAILIGKGVDKELPADIVVQIKGRVTIKGQIQQELDYEQLEDAVKSLRGNVDVLAVSGITSTRNPVHENNVREYVKDKLDIPVVCAHEMTGQLGFFERTVTCILNAGLLAVIKDLIESTKKILSEKSMDVPLMVVKGDGTLMHESVALKRPVETLLSGPAASIIGAEFLTGIEYAMILDMGGTTTDIANISNGKVYVRNEGARVGGWSTRVRAADVSTFGIGGDSHIRFDSYGKVQIGSKKVIPVSLATAEYPQLAEELEQYRRPKGYELCTENETDCFRLIRIPQDNLYTEVQQRAIEALKEHPHSLFWLARRLEKDADHIGMTQLVEDGYVGRISFTPTDILHAEGHLNLYDQKGARIALKIMVERMQVSETRFIIDTKRMIYRKLAKACVQSACDFEKQGFDIWEDAAAEFFLEKAFQEEEKGILQTRFILKKPVIAIGAPVKAWLYRVGQFLGTTVIIPEHAEVANAIGAAVGRILEEVTITIRYDAGTKQYLIYTPKERIICGDLETAKEKAVREAEELARTAAEKAGAGKCKVVTHQEDEYMKNFTTNENSYVQTIVKAIAAGKPRWIE